MTTNQNIENIFDYYDNLDNLDNLENRYFKIDSNNQEISFYDIKKKFINKYKYQILGKIVNLDDIMHWYWGWSQTDLSKSKIMASKKIFEYGLNLDSDNKFKQILLNSNIKINNNYSKEFIIALSTYLLKHPLVFSYKINTDNYINFIDDYYNIYDGNILYNTNYTEYVLLLS